MSSEVERLTQKIGKQLFAASRESVNGSGGGFSLDRRLMELTMRDPQLKAQLFRFVDVLPVLSSSQTLNHHLRQYLGPVGGRLPRLINFVLKYLPEDGWVGNRFAEAARWSVRKLARRFIAASDLPQAFAAVERLRAHHLAFTIDLVGEAVLSEAEADRYQQRYLELIDGLSERAREWRDNPLTDRDHRRALPKVNLSLKLSSLYSQFDPIDPTGTSAAVRERLRPILRRAKQRGAFVNLDMEQYSFKDVTLRIFREVLEEPEFRDWGDVGIVVQAYLRDSANDLKKLAEWARTRKTPVWVRLVKGAYWDFETTLARQNNWPVPVFTNKPESDANFERLTDFLLDHHNVLRPAIASHNIRSIAHALASAQERGIPQGSIEFQMLYGMADEIQPALIRLRHRVRIYTPMGELLPGMAYLVRRLLENTSNESFLRAGFLEHQPEEQLLMNPMEMLSRRRRSNGRRHQPAATASAPAPAPNPARFTNEPLSDFSREDVRAAMRDALKSVRNRFGEAYPLIVAGRAVHTDATIESTDPSHRRQIVGRSARATVDHARGAVAAAREAFPAWRDLPARRRAELLSRSAQIMRRRRFELAAWEIHETGKQWREADADVAEAIDYCDYYAREMLRLAEPMRRDVAGEQNEYFYSPRGVAVTIAPWNFPLAILCGMTAAALVAGNTVVMKPAEQSPVIAAKLMETFIEAGFPPGVVNFLPGVGEQIGPTLVNHPDVEIIAFTGSRSVGLEIQRQAAQTPAGQDHVKRVIIEMGGKNAIIIDESADLDEAVHGVVASAFGYAGQKCSACSRAIVLAPIHEAFVNRLVEVTRSLRIGPAEDPGAFVGPVIDQEARDRILHAIEKGKAESDLAYAADVTAIADLGWYIGPHVFKNVSPTASIAQEEIFGPVLAVLKAADLDEALRIANGTFYALTGGIYSRSPANVDRVRRDLQVGNLYINRKITGALVDRQPFGGFKLSGIGSKAGGPDYLQQFLIPRTVTENTLRRGFAPETGAADAGPSSE